MAKTYRELTGKEKRQIKKLVISNLIMQMVTLRRN